MKSPKTTFAGILAGILLFVGGAIKDRVNNPASPPVTFGNLAPAVAVALIGKLAKDD